MFSFNLWSEVPTPTARNTTLWYSLLSEREQEEIIQALEGAQRPAFIVDGMLIAISQASGTPPRGPLYAYLLARYRPAFGLRGLGFWIKKERAIVPVGTAWTAPGEVGGRFELYWLGDGEPVASVEISTLDGPPQSGIVLDRRNARVAVASVQRDGAPRSDPAELAWPLRFEGLVRLVVECPAFARQPERIQLITLKTAQDRAVGTALFVDGQ
jgi:hypothetical protein